MALGTITSLQLVPQAQGTAGGTPVSIGDLRMSVITVVGDSAYSSGGTTIAASSFGFTNLLVAAVLSVRGSASNNGAVQADFNNTTGKLQMFATSGTSPVGLVEAGSVNLSGVTVTLIGFGY